MTETQGRRSLIVGGLAGAATWFVGSRAPEARAANGDALRLGERNDATDVTTLVNGTAHSTAFRAKAHGNGSIALQGHSRRGTGVHGLTESGNGVSGESVFGTGVSGLSIEPGSYAVSGNSSGGVGVQGGSQGGIGVQGNCEFGVAVQGGNVSETDPAVQGWAQNGQTGVMGLSTTFEDPDIVGSPTDVGVFGVCDRAGGRGVLARSRNGLALQTRGRSKLSTSGIATVPSGASEVAIATDFPLVASAKVFASFRTDPGAAAIRWIEIDAAADTFTIHLTTAVPGNTAVAWLVLD